MGGYIKRDVERVETTALNTKVHRDIFNDFKDYCKYLGYPMNMVLEAFMQQYKNGRIYIDHADIMKWKQEDYEVDTLSTTFNKYIYKDFKNACKDNGYFVKNVIMAFMEMFSKKNLILEYINIGKVSSPVEKNVANINLEERKQIHKGMIRCPFCGRYVEALSDNWCLIQPIGKEEKYLACRKCEGKNGEYKY